MKSIKFKLLFDGHENDLDDKVFEASANGETVNFGVGDLLDINVLKESIDAKTFNELTQYFSFPGFSQYFIRRDVILFIVIYRNFQNRHQIYERGFWTLDN